MNDQGPISPFADFYHAEQSSGAPRVTATHLGGEQVLVNFPKQALVVDHPVALGGSAMGPSPGELLLASLAACTAVYVGREAQRQGVPVESVNVGTSFEIAWEPVDGPLDSIGYFTKIVKQVEVTGDLSDEQLAMVEFWVNHCSIGETLKRGVELEEHVTLRAGSGSAYHLPPAHSAGNQMSADTESCCGAQPCPAPVSTSDPVAGTASASGRP